MSDKQQPSGEWGWAYLAGAIGGLIFFGLILFLAGDSTIQNAFSAIQWITDDNGHGALQTLSYVLTPLIAMTGLWLFYRRAKLMEDANRISQENLHELASANDMERFALSAEMLSSNDSGKETAAIYSLRALGEAKPQIWASACFDLVARYLDTKVVDGTKTIDIRIAGAQTDAIITVLTLGKACDKSWPNQHTSFEACILNDIDLRNLDFVRITAELIQIHNCELPNAVIWSGRRLQISSTNLKNKKIELWNGPKQAELAFFNCELDGAVAFNYSGSLDIRSCTMDHAEFGAQDIQIAGSACKNKDALPTFDTDNPSYQDDAWFENHTNGFHIWVGEIEQTSRGPVPKDPEKTIVGRLKINYVPTLLPF